MDLSSLFSCYSLLTPYYSLSGILLGPCLSLASDIEQNPDGEHGHEK